MCRTTQTTYMLCLHTASSTQSCKSFFSFVRPKCKPIKSEIFMNDCCPPCTHFWDRHYVSQESRRECVAEFCVESGYHGPLTPSAVPTADGDGFFFGFIKDVEDPASRGQADSEARWVSELNARWEVDDHAAMDSMHDSKGKDKKPASISSTETVWPSAKDQGGRRRGPDEFGYDSDDGGHWLRDNGLIHPDEFDMETLERELCGEDGRLKPVKPMPSAAPQRGESDVSSPENRKQAW